METRAQLRNGSADCANELDSTLTEISRTDLFEKCAEFTRADDLREVNLYPYFRVISSSQDTEVMIDGKRSLMMGSNSYLGLTTHPKVLEAAREATTEYGSGCGGSRFLNGTLDIHTRLEERLAKLVGKETALCFTTGYQANVGAISGIVGKGDYIVGDKLNHASIVDGGLMSFGKMVRYNHRNTEHLEKVLGGLPPDAGILVISDSVFSMEGVIAPLKEIVRVAKQYGARVMIDEAHSIGVFGDKGAGLVAELGLTDDVDIIMGTFSKSLASIGGFIAGDANIIDYLRHNARSLMFSASMTPAATGAALASLDIMESEPDRFKCLWKNTERMREGLLNIGFNLGDSETPVIPVVVGEEGLCFRFWRGLTDAGLFVNPVVPPAVEPGNSLLRVSLMATHSDEQIDRTLEIFKTVAKDIGLV